ncbi:MAG: SIS domain-containing protein [Candidatus Methylomirabilota bacterium]
MGSIESYLAELEVVVRGIPRQDVQAVVDRLFEAWRRRQSVYLIGNGGSAATAAHMMNDLNKFTAIGDLPRFRAFALTDNIPYLTAIANDESYADIFVESLKNFLRSDDVVIAISGSGNSPNIVKAVEYARTQGATVIGFCGSPGGKLAQLADLKVIIPSPKITQQEDGHMILDHAIATALRERIEREEGKRG